METLESVNRESRERLYPSLSNPSWLVLRARREIFQRWLAQIDHKKLDVLDVGGRIQPYRSLLGSGLRSYVAVDLLCGPLVSIVANAEQIPVAADRFDLVICTQMLEYVVEPGAVIAEIYRVLRPGGYLLLSVPSVLPRDADHEAWRFLPEGLRYLLRSFQHVEVVAEGTTIGGFFRTVCICLMIFARIALLRTVLRYTMIPLLNFTGVLLQLVSNTSNDQFAANFSVLAMK